MEINTYWRAVVEHVDTFLDRFTVDCLFCTSTAHVLFLCLRHVQYNTIYWSRQQTCRPMSQRNCNSHCSVHVVSK